MKSTYTITPVRHGDYPGHKLRITVVTDYNLLQSNPDRIMYRARCKCKWYNSPNGSKASQIRAYELHLLRQARLSPTLPGIVS
jgi:hypothetical protein